ncbi:Testis-specific serine [Tyrophagus putrescentiae]|nr:Testis-specific serine [Tyrophagus putrescentiae]
MSPQLLMKVPYNPYKADIFATGVSLFLMLSEKYPLQQTTDQEVILTQQQRDYPQFLRFQFPQTMSAKAKALIELMLHPIEESQKKVHPVSSASVATAKTSAPPKLQVLERKTRAKPSKTEHSKGLLTVSAKISPLKSSVGKLTENSITSSTFPNASKSTVSKGKEKSKGVVFAGRHLGSACKVPPSKVGSSIPQKSDSKKAKLPSSSVQSKSSQVDKSVSNWKPMT